MTYITSRHYIPDLIRKIKAIIKNKSPNKTSASVNQSDLLIFLAL